MTLVKVPVDGDRQQVIMTVEQPRRSVTEGKMDVAPAPSRQLGERLRQLRLQHGLTQRILADRLGVSTPALCRWEKGQTIPRSSHILALAEAFNLSETGLLMDANDAGAELASESVLEVKNPGTRPDNLPAVSRQSLGDLLKTCKQKIAEAAGTSAGRVRIVIEI